LSQEGRGCLTELALGNSVLNLASFVRVCDGRPILFSCVSV
jgi:hypothetical protein